MEKKQKRKVDRCYMADGFYSGNVFKMLLKNNKWRMNENGLQDWITQWKETILFTCNQHPTRIQPFPLERKQRGKWLGRLCSDVVCLLQMKMIKQWQKVYMLGGGIFPWLLYFFIFLEVTHRKEKMNARDFCRRYP